MIEDFMIVAIENDFSVQRLSQNGDSTLYGALRKGGTERIKTASGLWETHVMGVWHLVELFKQEPGNLINQWHIPRYKMASKLHQVVTAAESGKKLSDPIVLCLESGLDLTIVAKNKFGFITFRSGAKHVEIKSSFLTKFRRDLRLLENAQSKVMEKSGEFYLKDVYTPAGNPVKSKYKSIIEAIAFEQLTLGFLDPGNFGVYSAFCSDHDFEATKIMDDSLIAGLIQQQFHFQCDAEYEDAKVYSIYMQTQDKVLAMPIWGKGIKVDEEKACRILSSAMNKLTRIQRLQFILMNGMQNATLFIALATVAGIISFDEYIQIQCKYYQPDSPKEQDLRKEIAYIMLYGQLIQEFDKLQADMV